MTDDVVVVPVRPGEAPPLKVGDKLFPSVYDWELTDQDLETAARELGETEEKKRTCLQKLKEKLSKESDIQYRQDDFYLLRFLRVRKYDVQKAYRHVKHFFEVRRNHPDYFILPQDLKSGLELNFITFLPYADEEGAVMFRLNLDRWNPAEMSLVEILQTATPVYDLVSMNPHCHINGVIGISDLTGMSARHLSELLWNGRFREIISIFQGGYPWRIKKLIFLNTNRLVRLAYNIVRPLLQRKIAERVVLLGSDVTELHEHVNPVLLPESLKGALKEGTGDASQHVLDNLPYLKYERSFIFP